MPNAHIDENGQPLSSLDSFRVAYARPGPFVGTPANSRGDHDGTQDPTTLFTVTGDVLVRIFAVCTETIVGAGAIEVGVAGNTAGLIAQITDATSLVANEIWNDATPTEVGAGLLSNVLGPYLVVNGLDIIETLGTANLTDGEVYYVCLWKPLSADGNVVGS